jgi:hypothetical protein
MLDESPEVDENGFKWMKMVEWMNFWRQECFFGSEFRQK